MAMTVISLKKMHALQPHIYVDLNAVFYINNTKGYFLLKNQNNNH